MADPENYIASASGDPLDYDYSSLSQTGAFAGNNTQQAGLLGDVLTAAIPYGDVSCIMGMATSIAVMRGDPKAGGSIDFLSREIGIVSPTAWARTPDGTLVFMSIDGLYKISGDAANRVDLYGGVASATPASISRGRLDRTLGTIDHNSTKILMEWDHQEFGVKIYLVPSSSDLPTTVVFWDMRRDAFWIDSIPAGIGPTATKVLSSDDSQRRVVMGSWDGYLRIPSQDAYDDDGQSFSSQVLYTPQQFNGAMLDSKIVGLHATCGARRHLPTPSARKYHFRVGEDALVAYPDSSTSSTQILTWGYQSIDRTRIRGACAIFEITDCNDSRAWSIESSTILTAVSGRIRT